MDTSKKNAEGQKFLQMAEKAVKTSMLKWKPDWETAADAYDKAGLAFKLGKSLEKAKEAYKKASHAHEQYNALFHSGKALEAAASCCKDMKQISDSCHLTQEAARQYRVYGKVDAACVALDKAAKLAGSNDDPILATDLYMQIYEMRMGEERPRQCKLPLQKALQYLLRMNNYERAVSVVQAQQEVYLKLDNVELYGKAVLTMIVVHLLREDYVAANKEYCDAIQKMPSMAHSYESKTADKLLSAYDEGDDEALDAVTNEQVFGFIDNEVGLAAKRIRVVGDGSSANKERDVVSEQSRTSGRSRMSTSSKQKFAFGADEDLDTLLAKPVQPGGNVSSATGSANAPDGERGALFSGLKPRENQAPAEPDSASAPEPAAPAAAEGSVEEDEALNAALEQAALSPIAPVAAEVAPGDTSVLEGEEEEDNDEDDDEEEEEDSTDLC